MKINKTLSPRTWLRAALALFFFLQVVSPACAHEEQQALAQAEQKAFQQAADSIAGAVVQLRHLGSPSAAAATGTVVAPGGWIITSLYGLEDLDKSAKTLVSFADGRRSSAKLVARDFSRHLALLQSLEEPSSWVPLQSAKAPQAGQWAIAVGRTFQADKVNLSVGVISASRRFGGKAVQTDAAVSPANYGGPLLNLSGEVIGILVPMAPKGQQGTEWYDSGIGFAVPLDPILHRLERMQAGHDIRPGQLGLTLGPGDPLRTPPVVAAVFPTGPAEDVGIAPGDRILALDGQRVSTSAELKRLVSGRDTGERVRLRLRKEDKEREVEVILAAPLPIP